MYENNNNYKVEYIGEKFKKDLLSYKVINRKIWSWENNYY